MSFIIQVWVVYGTIKARRARQDSISQPSVTTNTNNDAKGKLNHMCFFFSILRYLTINFIYIYLAVSNYLNPIDKKKLNMAPENFIFSWWIHYNDVLVSLDNADINRTLKFEFSLSWSELLKLHSLVSTVSQLTPLEWRCEIELWFLADAIASKTLHLISYAMQCSSNPNTLMLCNY